MDDLISRKAAIARIDKCVALSGIGLEPVMAIRDVKALISVLPAVDAAPVRRGEWKERRVDVLEESTIDAWQSARCSACGLYHTTPYLYNFTDYKFCPNCGARMGGEADG